MYRSHKLDGNLFLFKLVPPSKHFLFTIIALGSSTKLDGVARKEGLEITPL